MILETIAIPTVWGKALDAIKAVPWYIWIGLVIAGAWYIDRTTHGNSRFEAGAESVKAELRAERAAAVERSLEAAVEADTAGIERAEAEAETVEAIIERIEEAETNDENALDALLR